MSALAPHTAKAIIFTCIDERLESHITSLTKSMDGGAFHAALAGGGAAIVSETDSEVALKQIVAAYKINHVTNIYLESHRSCGAYNLAGVVFNSPIAEAQRLYEDLDRAASLVKKALEDAGANPAELNIHTQVVALDGEIVERPQMTLV